MPVVAGKLFWNSFASMTIQYFIDVWCFVKPFLVKSNISYLQVISTGIQVMLNYFFYINIWMIMEVLDMRMRKICDHSMFPFDVCRSCYTHILRNTEHPRWFSHFGIRTVPIEYIFEFWCHFFWYRWRNWMKYLCYF